jgi:hypothetical protein
MPSDIVHAGEAKFKKGNSQMVQNHENEWYYFHNAPIIFLFSALYFA